MIERKKTSAVFALVCILLLLAACENIFQPNDFNPTGSAFDLNPGISEISITGTRRYFSDLGLYTLLMLCRTQSSAALADTLPGGLLFTSKKNSTQHVLILKDHPIIVNPSATSIVIGVFCCNRYRSIPAEDDTFLLGPLTDNEELKRLVRLVRDKDISVNLGMVQRAVWMVTDSTGLTPAYIDSINALPPAP